MIEEVIQQLNAKEDMDFLAHEINPRGHYVRGSRRSFN